MMPPLMMLLMLFEDFISAAHALPPLCRYCRCRLIELCRLSFVPIDALLSRFFRYAISLLPYVIFAMLIFTRHWLIVQPRWLIRARAVAQRPMRHFISQKASPPFAAVLRRFIRRQFMPLMPFHFSPLCHAISLSIFPRHAAQPARDAAREGADAAARRKEKKNARQAHARYVTRCSIPLLPKFAAHANKRCAVAQVTMFSGIAAAVTWRCYFIMFAARFFVATAPRGRYFRLPRLMRLPRITRAKDSMRFVTLALSPANTLFFVDCPISF